MVEKIENKHEQIAKAESIKEQGNKYFKENDFKKALSQYSKIFAYTKGLIDQNSEVATYAQGNLISEQDFKKVQELEHISYLNISICHFKLGNYEKSIERANKAIEIRNNNPKVYFRRGLAYLELKEVDKAEVDLRKALDLEPGNIQIQKAIQDLNKKMKVQDQQTKGFYQGIFAKSQGDLYPEVQPEKPKKKGSEDERNSSSDEEEKRNASKS